MTCCRTRTSAPVTTAARSTRTAIPRCRSAAASAAIPPAPAAATRRRAPGFENFNFGGADAADLSDLFEGLFGAARRARARRRRPFGGFRQRARAAAEGRRRRLSAEGRLRRCRRAEAAADHAWPTARRSTSSFRRGSRTGPRSASPARARKGRAAAATRSSRSRSRRIASSRATATNIRLELPVTLKEAVLGAKVKVPTPEGPVMLTIPKGTSSGKVLRLKGRGFTAKDGKRGDQLVTVEIDLPADDAELQQFAEGWNGGGNPRAGLGV